ncbi:MAG: LEPR-XLL domain-containing protein, partial [Burkholderiaceae bacterium]|nr:LEPR-XLL domain-containing protein [Burkholderiaceae bacterium]
MSAIIRLARAVRDAYKLEPLEPRVLLSADPVLGAAHAILMHAGDPNDPAAGAYEPSADGHPAPHMHASLPEGWQDWPAPSQAQPALETHTFAVDARAFDASHAPAFMHGTLMAAANDSVQPQSQTPGEAPVLTRSKALAAVNIGSTSAASQTSQPTLTLNPGDVFEVELGGATPGNGTGHYDQLTVTGQASLDGALKVTLIDGYVPADGAVFTFLNYGTVSGSFADGIGLMKAGNGLYFEVQADSAAHALKLVAHRLDDVTSYALNLLSTAAGAGAAADAFADRAGEWLNLDYFVNNQAYNFSGSLALGQGLNLSGALTVSFTADVLLADPSGSSHSYDVWKIGLDNASGYLGVDAADLSKPGLSFSQIDAAVVIVDGQLGNDLGWVLGKGTAQGLSISGGSGLGLTASDLAVDFSLGLGTLAGVANHSGLDLSAQAQSLVVGGNTISFNDAGTLGDHAAASGTAHLSLGAISLDGSIGFAKSAAGLIVVGQGISGQLAAGGLTAGVTSADLGLLVLPDNTVALEASGGFYLVGGGFANVGADNALLKLNTTTVSHSGETLTAGALHHTFVDLPALSTPAVAFTHLHATIGSAFSISGNFAFERDATSGGMEVLATHAGVSLLAGSVSAGVSDASIAIVMNPTAGGIDLLEASGTANLHLGSDVTASAATASVRWNSSGADASGRALDVAGQSYHFGAGLINGLQEVSLTNAALAIGSFFSASGSFALERSSATVLLAADTVGTADNEATVGVLVDRFLLGAHGLAASAGIPGGPTLALAGVDFALALMSARSDPTRTWTSLQASASSVSLSGLPGTTVSGSNLAVSVNQASSLSDAVVDYAPGRTTLAVPTGAGSFSLTLDGARGELLEASGTLQIDLFDFVRVNGSIAFSRSDMAVVLADGSTVNTRMLTVGAHGLSAFAGVNAGQASALGFSLTNLDLALAIFADSANPARSWTSLQASAASAALIGVDGLTLAGNNLSLTLNQSTGALDAVVDYSAGRTVLAVPTSSSTSITLGMLGSEGEVLKAHGSLALDAFGFFQASGNFAVERLDSQVTLDGGEVVQTRLLTVGGSGINGFAGLNGGTANALGLQLTNLEFGLAMQSSKVLASRSWTSLQATVGSVGLIGVDGVTLTGSNLSVRLNQANTLNDRVVDFASNNLVVATGPGDTLALNMVGAEGETLKASGTLALDAFGFFQASGNFAVERLDSQVTLDGGEVVQTRLLTVGASNVNGFAGLNGGTANALGLQLTNFEFGLAMQSSKVLASRSWTSLQATVASVGLIGVDGLTLTGSNLGIRLNQASVFNDKVVDFSINNLVVATGPGDTLALNMVGAEGEILKASGTLALDAFGFFQASGNFAVERLDSQVTLAGGEVVQTRLLTVGASNVNGFAGLNGGTANALGLQLTNLEFGLAMQSSKVLASRSWTSLQAT